MKEKEKRIKDISLKNRLPSIFTDSLRKENYLKILLPDGRLNFSYNNKEGEFKKKDQLNYYHLGEKFICLEPKRLITNMVGILTYINFTTNISILDVSFSSSNTISSEEVNIKYLVREDFKC